MNKVFTEKLFVKAFKLFLLIGVVALIYFIITDIKEKKNLIKEIKSNAGYTNGVIIDHGSAGDGSSTYVKYEYVVENETFTVVYNLRERLNCGSPENKKCVGLNYTVAYSIKKPENSIILIGDYEKELFNYHY